MSIEQLEMQLPRNKEELRAARFLAGITQVELAEVSGVNINTVQAYEQGSLEIHWQRRGLFAVIQGFRSLGVSFQRNYDGSSTITIPSHAVTIRKEDK